MSSQQITFDHIHILSRNPRAAVDWYVDKLGGEVECEYEVKGAPQIFVRLFGIFLVIRGLRENESAAQRSSLEWGIDHFGFSVAGDFDAYCAGLKARGVKFTLEPTDFSATSRIAYIEDLEGVKIELLRRKN